MTGRKLTWGLIRKGCFSAGLVSWNRSQKRSRHGIRATVRYTFDLAVYETTAKENMQQCLRNRRTLCNRCRDDLVSAATDNACMFSWDVMLMVSNSTFAFIRIFVPLQTLIKKKHFSPWRGLHFLSLKQSRSWKLMKVNGKTLNWSLSVVLVWAKKHISLVILHCKC